MVPPLPRKELFRNFRFPFETSTVKELVWLPQASKSTTPPPPSPANPVESESPPRTDNLPVPLRFIALTEIAPPPPPPFASLACVPSAIIEPNIQTFSSACNLTQPPPLGPELRPALPLPEPTKPSSLQGTDYINYRADWYNRQHSSCKLVLQIAPMPPCPADAPPLRLQLTFSIKNLGPRPMPIFAEQSGITLIEPNK